MKTLFLVLFWGIFIQAQQSHLVNNTWYLEKLTHNNVDYPHPNTIAGANTTAQFSSSTLVSSLCNYLNANISFDNSIITFSNAGTTLGNCPNTPPYDDYNTFESKYFGIFFGTDTTSGFYPTYSYLIENINTILRLTLTNPNGDKAYFWSSNLSTADFSLSDLQIVPNPISDYFIIKTKNSNDKLSLFITDSSGKKIMEENLKNSGEYSIDVSHLPKGTYFMTVKNDRQFLQKKILKK